MADEPAQPSLRTVFGDSLGLLAFRRPSVAIVEHWPTYLALGLLFTVLAGIGRYWDNPRAELWQHAGLGSIAYVFCLSLFLWLIVMPLAPQRWYYRNVLVFVALTSPPALLYAIPVEQFMSATGARTANAWFLLFVAAWRVALLIWFLRVVAGLSDSATMVAALLPLTLIVIALSALNLEHVVLELMSGRRGNTSSPNDTAYAVVVALSIFSAVCAPFLVIAYVWLAYRAHRQRRG